MAQKSPGLQVGTMEAAVPATTIRDKFGRQFTYLRIALTDRCNLRCIYCMPEDGVEFSPADTLLTNEEIVRLVELGAGLGIRKVRFTGGEPLLRPNLDRLIGEISQIPGIENIHLTTNGVLLAKSVSLLRQAGLSGVNISIDTLRPERFKHITRRANLEQVLAGLDAACQVGFESVKINAVALREFNDDEIGDFIELTRERPVTVRFIELMPFDAHQIWKTGHFMGADHIIARIKELIPILVTEHGSPTEKHLFSVPGYLGKIGVIPAYTRSICGSCNRIRVTADGQLRNCLYSSKEHDLRALLRSGADDSDIQNLIIAAMGSKLKDGWDSQHEGANDPQGHLRDSMTQIGG